MRVDELINELHDMIADAKAVPLTGGKVMVDAEKVFDILDEMQDTMPAEVRQFGEFLKSKARREIISILV